MNLTLLDLTKLRGHAREVGLIESVLTAAPELTVVPGRTIKGTVYKTVDRTQLPNTGFTNANEGIVPSKSSFAMKLVECFIFRGSIVIDKAVAADHEDGPQALQRIEAEGVGKSAGIEIGKQFYYGTKEDTKGFAGLEALCPAAMTVDATGTGGDVGTSIYAVKFGPQFVQLIFGGNTTIQLPPFREQSVADGNGGQYDAYIANLTSWVGLQCVHPFAIGRIKNLTTQNLKGASDALIADLLARFPVGFEPDALFMTRQSRTQLQKSRTVVLQGNGKGDVGSQSGLVAPIPTEAFGIPIITTDNIKLTETIA